MRQKAVLMLVLACATGGSAVYLARGWLERQIKPQATVIQPGPQVETTTVVVAKVPLRFGDELNRESLREVTWPANSIPEGSFKSVNELLGSERRVALRDMGSNEVLLKSRVSGYGGRATLSTIVDEGMRAVTIRVNDVLGVAGFVLPGDRVDVVFTRPEDGKRSNQSAPVTDVLMQNVKVLAVDQFASSDKDKPVPAKAVTLEVSPSDSQRLALASELGSLALALRRAGSVQTAAVDTVTVNTLVGRTFGASADPAPEPVAEQPQGYNIRIYRAMDETVQPVAPEAPARPRPKPVPNDKLAALPRPAAPAIPNAVP